MVAKCPLSYRTPPASEGGLTQSGLFWEDDASQCSVFIDVLILFECFSFLRRRFSPPVVKKRAVKMLCRSSGFVLRCSQVHVTWMTRVHRARRTQNE